MAAQQCTTCRGSGHNPYTNNSSLCVMCDGTGEKYDPGREFTYEMGPFALNAAAAATTSIPQYFVGQASAGPTLNGVTCQVTGSPFRAQFWMAKSTFPFTIRLADAGSGAGRYFCPQQLQIHSHNLFGTSERPMPLPTPYVFERNIQITADVTDLGGAVGFCSVTNGSAAVAWVSGAAFNTSAAPGPPFPGLPIWSNAVINIGGVSYVISAVTSQNTLTLATTYQGATNANIAYSVSNTIRIAFKGQELSS